MRHSPRTFLAVLPFPRDTGYAITALRNLFVGSLSALGGADTRVLVSTTDGVIDSPDGTFHEADLTWTPERRGWRRIFPEAVRQQNVQFILGLDLPVRDALYSRVRRAGVKSIVSYLGAPSSGLRSSFGLALRRLELAVLGIGPDHFIYETESMQRTGTLGRGIPAHRTSVVPLGVDTERFRPDEVDREHAYREFGIPAHRQLLFYSGHFEHRKGVRVIIDAMRHLVDERGRNDVHALLCGNQPGEEQPFVEQLAGSKAAQHVTFGGYRHDIPLLHRSCALGVIASTGWDSMTMSSIEMQASGLPLLVSDLQGLPETIDDGVTGRKFPPGEAMALAEHIASLIDQPSVRQSMSTAARNRVVDKFSRSAQMANMTNVIHSVWMKQQRH